MEAFRAMKSQLQLLEKYKDKTIKINKCIERREEIIQDLKQFLNKGNLQVEEFAEIIPTKLINLRNATIIVLKMIRKWRRLMWNPQPFMWKSMNYIMKIGKDYEEYFDSVMFIRLQIFVADFVFFIPQPSIPIIDLSEDDIIYQGIADNLALKNSNESIM